MSIDPTSGAGSVPGHTPNPEVRKSDSISVTNHSTTTSIDMLKQAGSINGKVETMLPGGSIRIATDLGRMTFALAPPQFEPGTSVRLSLDTGSGRVLLQPIDPALTSRLTSGTAFTTPPPTMPERTIPLAIQELVPVAVGAGGTTNPQSTQALSVVFPNSGSPTFAAIAAFFPIVLRNGALERLTDRQNSRYAAGSRLAQMASTARVSALEKTEDGATHLRWTMPYFSEGTALYAHWQQSRNIQNGETHTHTILEVAFDFSGLVQIDALHAGDNISVNFLSEKKIPAELMAEIHAIARTLATSFEMELLFAHDHGPHILQRLQENKIPDFSDK